MKKPLLMSIVVAATALNAPAFAQTAEYLQVHPFFASNSPWNEPIEMGAPYSAAPALSSFPVGLTSWVPGGGNVAVYYASATDPVQAVLYNANTWSNIYSGAWKQSGNPSTIETTILASSKSLNPMHGNPYSTQTAGRYWNSNPSGLPANYQVWNQTQVLTAYIPANALPPTSSDGNTVIIQPNGVALEMYAPIKLSTGQWVSEMFTVSDAANGTGTGYDNGRTASMIENYAGIIRDMDISNGYIGHALAIVVPHSLLKAAFVSPAYAFDSNNANYSGPLPMGSHLAIPSTVNLSALGLTSALGKAMARAAQTYGIYVVDQGGSGISFVTQNAATSPALAAWSSTTGNDLITITESLVLMAK